MQARSRLTTPETRSLRKRTHVEYSKELFGKAKENGKKIFIEPISEKYHQQPLRDRRGSVYGPRVLALKVL